jgi:hypothetical protein
MNIKVLKVLFIVLFTSGIVQTSNFTDTMKKRLYYAQRGFKDQEHYAEFLDPHLHKVEQELKGAHYCSSHESSKVCQEYVDALLELDNVARHWVKRKLQVASKPTLSHYQYYSMFKHDVDNLAKILNKFPNEAEISDVQQELEQTVYLLIKINKEFGYPTRNPSYVW